MKKQRRNEIDPWIAWLGDHGLELKNELGLVNEPIQIEKVEKQTKTEPPEPEEIVQEVVEEKEELVE